jgi:hypothetical protein
MAGKLSRDCSAQLRDGCDLVVVGIGDPGCVGGSLRKLAQNRVSTPDRFRSKCFGVRCVPVSLSIDQVEATPTRSCAETELALAKTRDDNAHVAE